MSNDVNKWIDFSQFPTNERGNILWKQSVGKVVEFFYNNEKHVIEILDYGIPNKNYINVKIDDMSPKVVNIQKIKNLGFSDLFKKPSYLYNVGDVVNGSMVLEQLYIKEACENNIRRKYYRCKCLIDDYEYVIRESDLKRGKRCQMCICLATTHPNIVKFLLDKDDGYKYTYGSSKHIWAVCPICGYKKYIKVEELVYNGGISCPRCSDGLSYPNKFAFNVFEQINTQYEDYHSEYSPNWAGKMRYDNYILLKDGHEIIVEMDGGFHYNEYGKRSARNDALKNALAEEHGITVIRINCFYNKITERFDLVKNRFIDAMKEYFDLSNIDWNSANEAGISNRIVDVASYYNSHPHMTNQHIANHFHVNVVTIRHYLTVGERLGLCTYIRHDPNRNKTSIPLLLYGPDGSIIGSFISARQMAEFMKDKDFNVASINESSRLGKPYKGYIIKRITWEEYDKYHGSI